MVYFQPGDLNLKVSDWEHSSRCAAYLLENVLCFLNRVIPVG
jgi:hypothetical protein